MKIETRKFMTESNHSANQVRCKKEKNKQLFRVRLAKVQQRRAWSVIGWVTAWLNRMQLPFYYFFSAAVVRGCSIRLPTPNNPLTAWFRSICFDWSRFRKVFNFGGVDARQCNGRSGRALHLPFLLSGIFSPVQRARNAT